MKSKPIGYLSILKRSLQVVFLLLIATSCGCEEPVIYTNRAKIDPVFLEMYLQYKVDMHHYGYRSDPNHLTIQFTDEFGRFGKVGECTLVYDNQNEVHASIEIGREYWRNQGMQTQKALLYHELTHCTFYIGHSGKYGDIMFDNMKSVEVYWAEHMKEQIEKLFTVVIPEALRI